MMRVPYNLQDHQTVSNSGNFTDLVGIYPDNIPFEVQLRIDPDRHGDGFFFTMFGPSVTAPDVQGISMRSGKDIFLLVEECREKWAEQIVNFNRPVPKPSGGMRN